MKKKLLIPSFALISALTFSPAFAAETASVVPVAEKLSIEGTSVISSDWQAAVIAGANKPRESLIK